MGDRFELIDVCVHGDDAPILDKFCARIPADGLTAVVGPSGAGKSTMLRLLNRLDDPDAGRVVLDGRSVRDYDVLDLRRRVQLVGQIPVTFPGTAAANILAASHDADVPGLLERVGLSAALADREADKLSVGQAQRLSLARALALHPEVLALDEPTSALDPESKAGVEQLIRSLADDGLTVVMVTHEERQAGLADHVLEVQPSAT